MWDTQFGDWDGDGEGYFTSANVKFNANGNAGGLQLSALYPAPRQRSNNSTASIFDCGCDPQVSLGLVSSKNMYGHGIYTLSGATFGTGASSAGIQYGFWLQNGRGEIDGFTLKTRDVPDCTYINEGTGLSSDYGNDTTGGDAGGPRPATCWGDNAYSYLDTCNNNAYPEFQAKCCWCGESQLSTAARCFDAEGDTTTHDFAAVEVTAAAPLTTYVSDTTPHNYTIVWTEDEITFKIDDTVIRTIDTASAGLNCLGNSADNMYIVLSTEVAEDKYIGADNSSDIDTKMTAASFQFIPASGSAENGVYNYFAPCAQIESPTASPTASLTAAPTAAPTGSPIAPGPALATASPTAVPTTSPTTAPTAKPTSLLTASPAASPSAAPTSAGAAVEIDVVAVVLMMTLPDDLDISTLSQADFDTVAAEYQASAAAAAGITEDQIERVEFYIDGKLIGAPTTRQIRRPEGEEVTMKIIFKDEYTEADAEKAAAAFNDAVEAGTVGKVTVTLADGKAYETTFETIEVEVLSVVQQQMLLTISVNPNELTYESLTQFKDDLVAAVVGSSGGIIVDEDVTEVNFIDLDNARARRWANANQQSAELNPVRPGVFEKTAGDAIARIHDRPARATTHVAGLLFASRVTQSAADELAVNVNAAIADGTFLRIQVVDADGNAIPVSVSLTAASLESPLTQVAGTDAASEAAESDGRTGGFYAAVSLGPLVVILTIGIVGIMVVLKKRGENKVGAMATATSNGAAQSQLSGLVSATTAPTFKRPKTPATAGGAVRARSGNWVVKSHELADPKQGTPFQARLANKVAPLAPTSLPTHGSVLPAPRPGPFVDYRAWRAVKNAMKVTATRHNPEDFEVAHL